MFVIASDGKEETAIEGCEQMLAAASSRYREAKVTGAEVYAPEEPEDNKTQLN